MAAVPTLGLVAAAAAFRRRGGPSRVAIFHMTAQVVGRGSGRSAVAAAAYRAAARLHDERLGRDHDFTAKAGVVHSAVLLPPGAPDEFADREVLWNAVEAGEKRRDAQLAREIEFALPEELPDEDNIALARAFVQERFVERGMVADLNVHRNVDPDGRARPHAHVMLTMRGVGAGGFGAKRREWNSTLDYVDARAALAVAINQRLAARGFEARVDHRSYEQRGIALEPQTKIGSAAHDRHGHRAPATRVAEHRGIAARNGERITAGPAVALEALTEFQSTFTRRDLARFVARHSDGAEQFARVMARVEASPELVRLGVDGRGEERFTSRAMLAVERQLEADAAALSSGRAHGVEPSRGAAFLANVRAALARTGSEPGGASAAGARGGSALSPEQREAARHVTRPDGLSLVVGYAGTGKSTMLGAARAAWEKAGYRVRGAALSGIAAEGLQHGSGIASRTLASLEHAWSRDRDRLEGRDVLVVDEAGMVGSRQLGRVLAHARAAGAKVVLVGDPEQLQAIEAGGAFRALLARHGAAELRGVRRQRDGWQQEATRELATARTGRALARYEAAGMLRARGSPEEARAHLIERWAHDRRETPGRSQVLLAYTREDVRALNEMARAELRAAGELDGETTLRTAGGGRAFAAGDRLMFLRNERSLGVGNGTLGTVEGIEGQRVTARLDGEDRRRVTFDVRDYGHLAHGYAATVHKSQGVTVDRSYVLASRHMDRHAAYVALTRHRVGTEVAYARGDFTDREGRDRFAELLGRERAKDTTLDHPAGRPRRGRDGAATITIAGRRTDMAAATGAGTGQAGAGATAPEDLARVRQAAKERVAARHAAAESAPAGQGTGRGRGPARALADGGRRAAGRLDRVRQEARDRATARHAAEARAREPEAELAREEAHRRHDAERAAAGERERQAREGERGREKDRGRGAGLSL